MDPSEDFLFEDSAQKPVVLFVDDEPSVLKALTRFARQRKWDADTAISGEEALKLAAQKQYDVVVSDMRMPKMDGTEFLHNMKVAHPNTARILMTGYSDLDALEKVINESGISNYVTKPWNDHVLQEIIETGVKYVLSERERKRLEVLTQQQNKKLSKIALVLDKKLKESNIETEQALSLLHMQEVVLDKKLKESSIETEQALSLLYLQEDRVKESALDSLSIITKVLSWKEGYDHGYTKFVEEYGVLIAEKLELEKDQIENIKLAAKLQLLGLLCLPDSFRYKPQFSLTKEEREQYEKYPLYGEIAVSSSAHLASVGKIIRHHQEFINGNGFPDGLYGNDIPIESQIIGLLGDFYDAFSGKKVKELEGVEGAKAYIEKWKGKHYDVSLTQVFFDVIEKFDWQEKSRKKISLEELKVGDVLAEDIITNGCLTLLKSETVISNAHIVNLRKHQEKFDEVIEIVVEVEVAATETVKSERKAE